MEYVNFLDKPEWKDADTISIYNEVSKMFGEDVKKVVQSISCEVHAVRIGGPEDYIFENHRTTDVLKALHNKLVDERETQKKERDYGGRNAIYYLSVFIGKEERWFMILKIQW